MFALLLFDSGRLDDLGPMAGPALDPWASFPGPVLSTAAPAGNRDDDLGLFAGVRILDQVADVDDALKAGVGRFGNLRDVVP